MHSRLNTRMADAIKVGEIRLSCRFDQRRVLLQESSAYSMCTSGHWQLDLQAGTCSLVRVIKSSETLGPFRFYFEQTDPLAIQSNLQLMGFGEAPPRSRVWKISRIRMRCAPGFGRFWS